VLILAKKTFFFPRPNNPRPNKKLSSSARSDYGIDRQNAQNGSKTGGVMEKIDPFVGKMQK
jgi:hypothetical protein